MATPNMPSSAQDIINNFLSGGYSTQAQANPYRVDVDPFRPPVSDTPEEDDKLPTDPCPDGFIYDPVMKRCMPIEEESSDRPDEPDRDDMIFRQMQRDPSTPFGASNILDDYQIDSRGGDDILLRFDPSVGALPPIFGLGLLDTLLGGNKRREDRFNEAMQTYVDAGYGQQLNNGTFQVFTPQQYYNTVRNNPLQGLNASGGASTMTVEQAVDSVMNPTPQSGTSEGSPIAQDLSGGLLGTAPLTTVDSQGNRSRNDTAYRAAVARNIERNKRNNPYGVSGFKEGVGFTRGR